MTDPEESHPERKRDKEGRFIKTSVKTEGAANILSRLIHTHEGNNDEALIDIKVTNPLHRIIQVLQEIKNHQSTTVSLRFTIPLIALPIVILAAFQLGRVQSACSWGFSSQAGVIRNLTLAVPKENSNPVSSLFFFRRTAPKPQGPTQLMQEKRTVLLTSQGETIEVQHSSSLNLDPFEGREVILSGGYSGCNHIITLDSLQNISLSL